MGASTDKSIQRVLKTTDLKQFFPEPIRLRDRCIIKIFAYTMIQRHELLDLDVRDIDFKRKRMAIKKRKGLKRRKIDLPEDLVKDLKNYIGDRNKGLLFKFSVSEGSGIRQVNKIMNYIEKMEIDVPSSEPWR